MCLLKQQIIKMKKIVPYIIGGGQEGGYRSGTENIVGIAGFGAAAAEERAHFAENCGKITALRDLCAEKAVLAGARPNIPAGQRAPHVLSLTLPSIKSETMLNFLSSKGFCVSAGSACSSHSKHISSALVGFGLSEFDADSTIRVSFSEYNTEEEIEEFCQGMPRYKRPRRIIFDKVPRNPTGKIQKNALREKYCGVRLVEAETTK
jgi:cysteine desulfurase